MALFMAYQMVAQNINWITCMLGSIFECHTVDIPYLYYRYPQLDEISLNNLVNRPCCPIAVGTPLCWILYGSAPSYFKNHLVCLLVNITFLDDLSEKCQQFRLLLRIIMNWKIVCSNVSKTVMRLVCHGKIMMPSFHKVIKRHCVISVI